MVRKCLSVLFALIVLAGTTSFQALAQEDEPAIEYGAISGNAFGLFEDETGTGVQVVAFGPSSTGSDYGVVYKNHTDDPVYGAAAVGDISGDDGLARATFDDEGVTPYAIPTDGLGIQWSSLKRDQEVGEDASFDGEVDYSRVPEADGAPRVPVPIDAIQRDADTLTAHVFNGYAFDLLAGVATLVCLDGNGDVTSAAGAVLREDAYESRPIPSGEDANYDFELTGDTDCEYFLIGAGGEDVSVESTDTGSRPILDEPQVPSQASQRVDSSATSSSTGIVGPVTDCSPFVDFEQAQVYYLENPAEQPTIDPDSDGLACEVYFGVEPAAGGGSGSVPADGNGTGDDNVATVPETTVPGAAPVQQPPDAGSPVYTGFGGLDGVDFDCYDFATPGEAQAYFEADGGSVSNNADALDRNNNGLACEPGEFD